MSLKRIRMLALGAVVAVVAIGPPVWFVVLGHAPAPVCASGQTPYSSQIEQEGPPSDTVEGAVDRAVAGTPYAPSRDEIGTVVGEAGAEQAPAGDIVLAFPTVKVTVLKTEDGSFSPVGATWCAPSAPASDQVSIQELA